MSKACITETSGGLLYANLSTPRLCIAATVATAVITDGTRFCIVTYRTWVCNLHPLVWDSYTSSQERKRVSGASPLVEATQRISIAFLCLGVTFASPTNSPS